MSKYFKHFCLITKHRHQVIKNAFHMGIFFHALKHDLSKYQPKEFIASAKCYQGNKSPVFVTRELNDGYSFVAVHHTNKNRHHYEYWVDFYRGYALLKAMPYKYAVEYVCDVLAASKTYDKKNFSGKVVYDYFMQREKYYLMHPATKEFVKTCFLRYEENRFKNLKKKHTKPLYQEILKKYQKVILIQMEETTLDSNEVFYGKQ